MLPAISLHVWLPSGNLLHIISSYEDVNKRKGDINHVAQGKTPSLIKGEQLQKNRTHLK